MKLLAQSSLETCDKIMLVRCHLDFFCFVYKVIHKGARQKAIQKKRVRYRQRPRCANLLKKKRKRKEHLAPGVVTIIAHSRPSISSRFTCKFGVFGEKALERLHCFRVHRVGWQHVVDLHGAEN